MDINDDSREKLEADMREYFSHWIGGTSRTQAAIIGWLDRQAAITTRECVAVNELGCEACRAAQKREIASMQAKLDKCYKPSWEYCETCEAANENDVLTIRIAELQSKLDAYDETDMELPKDADGEYIRIGDTVVEIDGTSPFKVMSLTYYENRVDVSACGCDPRLLRHVNPRTIEDVIMDAINDAFDGEEGYSVIVKDAADEIRELLGSDGE